MTPAIPVIKVSNNTDTKCIRRPYSKAGACYSVYLSRMCAQFFVCMIVHTGAESLFLIFRNLYRKCIWIIHRTDFFTFRNAVLIRRHLTHRKHCCKIPCFILLFHFISLFVYKHFHTVCIRKESLYQYSVSCHSRRHQISRCRFLSVNNCFNLRPIHIFIYFTVHKSPSCLYFIMIFLLNCSPLFQFNIFFIKNKEKNEISLTKRPLYDKLMIASFFLKKKTLQLLKEVFILWKKDSLM